MMATSGREALEVLRSESNFALVVTDINMPDLDGIDLLKQVRYSRPNLPVIVSSGRDQAERDDHRWLYARGSWRAGRRASAGRPAPTPPWHRDRDPCPLAPNL